MNSCTRKAKRLAMVYPVSKVFYTFQLIMYACPVFCRWLIGKGVYRLPTYKRVMMWQKKMLTKNQKFGQILFYH